MGAAFAFPGVAAFLVLSALLSRRGTRAPALLPLGRAVRVAVALVICHSLIVGLMTSLGMWHQGWPWVLGALPFLLQ